MKINENELNLIVESNYNVPEEGKGKKDAVNFLMRKDNLYNPIYSLISVSTEDARKFAQSIISLCESIENGKEVL